jgi:hypothetical protein
LGNPKVYNLAFGDVTEDGEIDDVNVTNNQDRNRIIATVALTMKKFFESHPEKEVQIQGSTDARTRLYRMAISKHRDDFGRSFYIYGRHDKTWRPFRQGLQYDAFMFCRRN